MIWTESTRNADIWHCREKGFVSRRFASQKMADMRWIDRIQFDPNSWSKKFKNRDKGDEGDAEKQFHLSPSSLSSLLNNFFLSSLPIRWVMVPPVHGSFFGIPV
jgi:hypothetical protein